MCSFREPMLIDTQTTYSIPPPSTIYGIISAVCGFPVTYKDTLVAAVLFHTGIGKDFESIWKFEKTRGLRKQVPYQREVIWSPTLYLYLTNNELAQAFQNPSFPISIGRSQDLAYIADVSSVKLDKTDKLILEKTFIPYSDKIEHKTGELHYLRYNIDPDWADEPRKPSIRPYLIFSRLERNVRMQGYHDIKIGRSIVFDNYE